MYISFGYRIWNETRYISIPSQRQFLSGRRTSAPPGFILLLGEKCVMLHYVTYYYGEREREVHKWTVLLDR